jgi:hypothetical protein
MSKGTVKASDASSSVCSGCVRISGCHCRLRRKHVTSRRSCAASTYSSRVSIPRLLKLTRIVASPAFTRERLGVNSLVRRLEDDADSSLASDRETRDCPTMRLTPDAKRRVVLPLPIQKGDILLLDEQGQNQWLLTRIERPKPMMPGKLRGKSAADALARSAGADVEVAKFKSERVPRVKL